MKKTILFLAITLLFFACSKNDEAGISQQELPLNYNNMAGNWKLTSIIKPDGSIAPFVGFCPTKSTSFIITPQQLITQVFYYSDCASNSSSTSISYFFEGNMVKNADGVFSDARVTSLKTNAMKIEYDEIKSFTFLGSNPQVKGAILTK